MVLSISATKAAAILAFLSATVQGHIIMTTPVPFDFPDSDHKLDPLHPNGDDFPCKFTAGYSPAVHDKNAPMAAGSSGNTLAFQGVAVHGGGSCQVSVTTDTIPTKNSQWQVIKSIEGGCPIEAPGNLGSDPSLAVPNTFQYSIPSDLVAGKYTLAWTWFNRIGNREMYMNCAPITVGGGSSKRAPTKINKKRQSSRPAMFEANIGNGCAVKEGPRLKFPDPGPEVQRGTGEFDDPVGDCGPKGPSSGSSGSSDAPTPVSSSSPAPAASSPPADAAPSTGPGSFVETPEGTDKGDSAPEAPAPADSSDSPAPAPAPVPAPVPAPSSGSCTEGSWTCAADGLSFTRCASGAWSAPMNMAAGTECTPGEDANLSVHVTKRSMRFVRRS